MKTFSVRIFARTLAALRALEQLHLDLQSRAAQQTVTGEYVVPALLSQEAIEQVQAAGYRVEIVAYLTAVAEERRGELSSTNRFGDERGIAEFAARTVSGYMTADEVESALANLQRRYPDLVTLIPLPHLTWQQRKSSAVRVRAGANQSRAGVLFTGSMHAREWGGADACIAFLVNLINAYRANAALTYGGKTFTAAQVQTILQNVDLFVFPDVNPDGKVYSQTVDMWWRKNRNPNAAVDPAHPGVDLNRNFDFLWRSGIGTSALPAHETYKGSAPFSEPETCNVRYLFDTFDSIRYYVDIHSYSGLILYPWGDDDNQNLHTDQNFQNPAYDGRRGTSGNGYAEFISTLDENTLRNLANRMNDALAAVRGTRYIVQQSVGLYPTTATSDDYLFARHFVDATKRRVYPFTIEFGHEFIPPYAEMQKIIKELSAAMTEFCLAASSDLCQRDNLGDTGAVPSRGAFWDSPDIWVRNAADGGTTHQATVRGHDNFIYVRMRNRGRAEARNVKGRLYLANFAGTEFVHPGDWIPLNPGGGGGLNGQGTYLIGEFLLPALAAGAEQIACIRWPVTLIPPDERWHPCLLVEVTPNDGLPEAGEHVWQNNNLSQKNITIINGRRGQTVNYDFIVGSVHGVTPPASIALRRIHAPANLQVFLEAKEPATVAATRAAKRGLELVTVDETPLFALVAPKQGSLPLQLRPGITKPMGLRVTIPADATEGETYELQAVQVGSQRSVMGGVTLQVRVVA